MMPSFSNTVETQINPILLYNDECGVCRRIASWVKKSIQNKTGDDGLVVRAIGEDPEALKLISPDLNIWDAYATIHLVMPDGSMKVGGEAVAEVFRIVPSTKWFAWSFSLSLFGFRPIQAILNLGYAVLADARPIFGCESCGAPAFWARPIQVGCEYFESSPHSRSELKSSDEKGDGLIGHRPTKHFMSKLSYSNEKRSTNFSFKKLFAHRIPIPSRAFYYRAQTSFLRTLVLRQTLRNILQIFLFDLG